MKTKLLLVITSIFCLFAVGASAQVTTATINGTTYTVVNNSTIASQASNGNVNLCCHDWTHMRNFVNIIEKQFSEIWEGEELNKYRKILEKGERWRLPECKNCDNFQEWDKQNLYYEYRKHPARTFFESNLL